MSEAKDFMIQAGHDYMHIRGQMFHGPACLQCSKDGVGWLSRLNFTIIGLGDGSAPELVSVGLGPVRSVMDLGVDVSGSQL